MSTLYIVATPIGNLEDVGFRTLRILSEVDLILCEDTRVTKVLLLRHNIKTPLLSYHQHSKLAKIDYIANLLKSGKNLALVSDAGTPGISDPGNQLIEQLTRVVDDLKIIPIPGPSALMTAASISGFPMDRFMFLGFAPVKNKRHKFFEEVLESEYPVIFYESPYRIIKTLKELELKAESYKIIADLVVCRELTKMFETIYRGTPQEIIQKLKPQEIRGEFTVVVRNKKE
jgi:16S rRNA (cytidine1402-2'-O)-methyltransferase